MLVPYGEAVAKFMTALAQLEGMSNDAILRGLPEWLDTGRSISNLLGMGSVLRQMDRIGQIIASGAFDRDRIIVAIRQLRERLGDELEGRQFLYVPQNRVVHFEAKQPFGLEVADKLPDAIFDIEEASKCLALDRATACVFHLMRATEVGLHSLASLLRIPYAPSWEAYLRQINDRIQAKHKSKGVKWKRDEPFFKEVAADLQTIKIVWRNPTMHVVRRYTSEEAEEIFVAVRGFLQHLCKKL